MTGGAREPAEPLPGWLAAMLPPGARRYRVGVGDGVAMAVTETGDEHALPVVCVHGNPSWGFLYRKVMTELAGAGVPVRVIAPDLVGLGLSDKPRDPAAHTLPAHAGWMAALLDRLAIERAIFVVQDWGGPIGVLGACARPGRLAGLVVLNTVLGPPRPGFRPTRFHRFARLPVVSDVTFRLLGFPQNAMAMAQGDRATVRGPVARAYRFPLRHLRDRVAPLALARMVPDSLEHPSIAPLGEVRAHIEAFGGPAAIVWGDRDPVLGRVRTFIERLLPRAEVTRTRAGHFSPEEVPQPIAAAIRQIAVRLGA